MNFAAHTPNNSPIAQKRNNDNDLVKKLDITHFTRIKNVNIINQLAILLYNINKISDYCLLFIDDVRLDGFDRNIKYEVKDMSFDFVAKIESKKIGYIDSHYADFFTDIAKMDFVVSYFHEQFDSIEYDKNKLLTGVYFLKSIKNYVSDISMRKYNKGLYNDILKSAKKCNIDIE